MHNAVVSNEQAGGLKTQRTTMAKRTFIICNKEMDAKNFKRHLAACEAKEKEKAAAEKAAKKGGKKPGRNVIEQALDKAVEQDGALGSMAAKEIKATEPDEKAMAYQTRIKGLLELIAINTADMNKEKEAYQAYCKEKGISCEYGSRAKNTSPVVRLIVTTPEKGAVAIAILNKPEEFHSCRGLAVEGPEAIADRLGEMVKSHEAYKPRNWVVERFSFAAMCQRLTKIDG